MENKVTPDFIFTYHPDQRKLFRDETLIKHWKKRYPELFDADDIRRLRTEPQKKYHFFEWLSAVLLFEATGYLSLVECYTSKKHPAKRNKIAEVVGPEIFSWVSDNESGQPDLFVYHPDSHDWFFCEVKGGPDRINTNQKRWMEAFNALQLGKKIRIIQLTEYLP